MSQKQNKYLLTQSLLSSWQWGLQSEKFYEEFLQMLRGEKTKQNKYKDEGIRFENVLNATLNGAEIEPTHEWYKPIKELYEVLYGAQQQVAVSKGVMVEGIQFVLYGKLDYLLAGTIYDTKFSSTYRVGKYLDSPQHSMYLALVPEAREFQYKICDGTYVYTETYRPDETEPIERTIKHFMNFLDKQNLVKIYCDNWKSKY